MPLGGLIPYGPEDPYLNDWDAWATDQLRRRKAIQQTQPMGPVPTQDERFRAVAPNTYADVLGQANRGLDRANDRRNALEALAVQQAMTASGIPASPPIGSQRMTAHGTPYPTGLDAPAPEPTLQEKMAAMAARQQAIAPHGNDVASHLHAGSEYGGAPFQPRSNVNWQVHGAEPGVTEAARRRNLAGPRLSTKIVQMPDGHLQLRGVGGSTQDPSIKRRIDQKRLARRTLDPSLLPKTRTETVQPPPEALMDAALGVGPQVGPVTRKVADPREVAKIEALRAKRDRAVARRGARQAGDSMMQLSNQFRQQFMQTAQRFGVHPAQLAQSQFGRAMIQDYQARASTLAQDRRDQNLFANQMLLKQQEMDALGKRSDKELSQRERQFRASQETERRAQDLNAISRGLVPTGAGTGFTAKPKDTLDPKEDLGVITTAKSIWDSADRARLPSSEGIRRVLAYAKSQNMTPRAAQILAYSVASEWAKENDASYDWTIGFQRILDSGNMSDYEKQAVMAALGPEAKAGERRAPANTGTTYKSKLLEHIERTKAARDKAREERRKRASYSGHMWGRSVGVH